MIIINRILCPVDFSDFSRQALKRAAAIAKDHGGALTVLHIVPLPAPLFAPGVEWNAPIAFAFGSEERKRLLTSLQQFVASTVATEVPLDVDVIDAPSIPREILAQAGRLHADLIVMGTHGRGGFQRLVFGSVTENVMRTAEQPVMTVGLPDIEATAPSGAFSRIVCGVDFSDCSIAALKHALSLAEGAKAHFTAVNVLEWMPVGYDPLVRTLPDFMLPSSAPRVSNCIGSSQRCRRQVFASKRRFDPAGRITRFFAWLPSSMRSSLCSASMDETRSTVCSLVQRRNPSCDGPRVRC
jgi:nucleotide-binding universal stress UspA family protein